MSVFQESTLTTLTTNLPSYAPSLQPMSILPSCLKTKTNPTNPKTLPRFCKSLGFCLSPTPSSSSFSRGAWASSLPCHPLRKLSGSNAQYSTNSGLEAVTATLASCPVALLLLTIFSLGKIVSSASQVSFSCRFFSALFQEILALLGGIWARIPHYPFRGMDISRSLPIRKSKLPIGSPHSFLNSWPLWEIRRNPRLNWAKAPLKRSVSARKLQSQRWNYYQCNKI